MRIVYWIIPALWVALLVYWIAGATRAKRTLARRSMWLGAALRILIIAVALLTYRIPALHYQTHSLPALVVGTAICAVGIGLAITARTYLGRNWGMPASVKENPDLITGGPYQYIRHPIYTGILLAMLGTAIGESVFWLLLFVLFGTYFLFAARREEHLMLQQFPDQYPAYMKRTKMLVPFVL